MQAKYCDRQKVSSFSSVVESTGLSIFLVVGNPPTTFFRQLPLAVVPGRVHGQRVDRLAARGRAGQGTLRRRRVREEAAQRRRPRASHREAPLPRHDLLLQV